MLAWAESEAGLQEVAFAKCVGECGDGDLIRSIGGLNDWMAVSAVQLKENDVFLEMLVHMGERR